MYEWYDKNGEQHLTPEPPNSCETCLPVRRLYDNGVLQRNMKNANPQLIPDTHFFEYHKLTKANQYFAKLCLVLMLEQQIDINSLDWSKFFKNSNADPRKILLLANIHTYRLVKDAANFLCEFNPSILIDLNDLPNKRYLDSSFNTELFDLFLLESQKKIQYLVEGNKKTIKTLQDQSKDSVFEINTKQLVDWQLLKQFTKNEDNAELFCLLIEKKIIYPGLLSNEIGGEMQTLFEILMLKPSNLNLLIVEKLFESHINEFKLNETFNYFKDKLNILLTSLNNKSIQKEVDNLKLMLRKIELAKINQELHCNLLIKSELISEVIVKV